MNINVNGGHSRLSSGASSYLDEVSENRRIKDALISELKKRGHRVTDSTSDKSGSSAVLIEQAAKANRSGASIAVSIHLNAGGGTGCEVWYWDGSTRGRKHAASISECVSRTLGLNNRGAKSSTKLYWLRHTTMVAVLVEVCFVDSVKDYESYKKAGYAAVAKAIADGIERGAI